MPKTKISEYSATANSNTDVASINIDEGCAPSGINNAIRAIMGHLKDFQSGTSNDPFTVGSSGSLTLSYGTANGVAYLNGSKVVTTGSAMTFDGSTLAVTGALSATTSITSTGSVGNVSTDSTGARLNFSRGADNYFQASSAGGYFVWIVNGSGSNAMTLDASGRLLVGLTSSIASNGIAQIGGHTDTRLIVDGSSTQGIYFTKSGADNGTFRVDGSGNYNWFVKGAGTANMTLDASGNLLVGATNASQGGILRVVSASAEAGTIATFGYTANGSSVYILDARATGQNNSGTAMLVLKNTSTSRSISAAGTINASGADYAEYMTKAGNFTIAKGDVVGIDAQGNLTNVFDNAVSFMVKSTDPSYVGGDSWGSEEAIGLSMPKKPSQRQATEEVEAETDEEFAVRFAQYEADQSAFDAALEAARQRVDRIAFAGQVPVNVMGATAGQYIIPVNDNGAIKGEAVSNPTFEQYQISVGKVIAIESDGRAKIIVKVA